MHNEHSGPLSTKKSFTMFNNDEEKDYSFFPWFLLCFILGSLVLTLNLFPSPVAHKNHIGILYIDVFTVLVTLIFVRSN